jgi:hypothetical protein
MNPSVRLAAAIIVQDISTQFMSTVGMMAQAW